MSRPPQGPWQSYPPQGAPPPGDEPSAAGNPFGPPMAHAHPQSVPPPQSVFYGQAAPGRGLPAAGFGYGFVPAGARPSVRKSSHTKLIAFFVIGMLVVVGAFAVIAKVVTPTPATSTCPPRCPTPPIGKPVQSNPVYTAADGSFSFEYPPASDNLVKVSATSNGKLIELQTDEGGLVSLQGGPADGQSAEQVVTSFLRAKFPDAHRSYVIPNAFVGYQKGYGEVDDVYLQSTSGSETRDRLVILSAVKNDVEVLAIALGPYHPWARGGFSDGHPSGVATVIALVMDPYVNSFRWKGDPAR